MVMTRQRGGFSSSSRTGVESSDVELHKLIVAKVSRVILEDMSDMFGMIKEGFIEMMDDCTQTFQEELTVDQFEPVISLSAIFVILGLERVFFVMELGIGFVR